MKNILQALNLKWITLLLLLWFIVFFCIPYVNAQKSSPFEHAVNVVLEHEGGLSNDKNDPGGITKYGISLRYLRSEHIDINGDGKTDSMDVIHLTQTEADDIYYKEWWERYHFGLLKNLNISTKLFDTSVNIGMPQTARITKRALNRFINGVVLVDTKFDKGTIDILNNIEPVVFLDSFRAEEEDFYKAIVHRRPSLKVFLHGWLLRAAS